MINIVVIDAANTLYCYHYYCHCFVFIVVFPPLFFFENVAVDVAVNPRSYVSKNIQTLR